MKRREFSKAQKGEMIRRASDEKGQIFCEGCGLNVTGKRIEFDHRIAEALIVDKRKPLTADDGQLLGAECCHRAPGGKTALDQAIIAEAKRREVKIRGGRDHTGPQLRGRNTLRRGRKPPKRTADEIARMLGDQIP